MPLTKVILGLCLFWLSQSFAQSQSSNRSKAVNKTARPSSKGPRKKPRVTFRIAMESQLDGGRPSDTAVLPSGEKLSDSGYQANRAALHTEFALGSRGLLSPSLSTYVAGWQHFHQARAEKNTAIADIRDAQRNATFIYSGFAETENSLPSGWGKTFLRAGRQFYQGPLWLRFDGARAEYSRDWLTFEASVGQRSGDFSQNASARPAFQALGILLGGSPERPWLGRMRALHLLDTWIWQSELHYDYGTKLQLDWLTRGTDDYVTRNEWRAKFAIGPNAEWVNSFAITEREDILYQWLWNKDDRLNSSGLFFGALTQQWQGQTQLTSRFFRNLDLALTLVGNHRARSAEWALQESSLELRLEGELRPRRGLRVAQYLHGSHWFRDLPVQSLDVMNQPDPLALAQVPLGEMNWLESGSLVQFSAGPKRIAATIEWVGRLTEFLTPYQSETDWQTRSSARFSLESWFTNNIRLRGEYSVTIARLPEAPELQGLKRLRILVEGTL